jgi:hypothetical protein
MGCQARPSAVPSAAALPRLGARSATAPTRFVAFSQTQNYQRRLKSFSTTTGQVLGTISDIPKGMHLQSAVLAGSGVIWVTSATGPRFRNDTAGADPAPDSCRSSIVDVHPGTGRAAALLTFRSSQLVGDAVPSPSGDRVAYLESGCRSSFADSHLVIRDLHDGGQITIGANATPCHLMSGPSWSSDGKELTFTFSPAAASPSTGHGAPGTCPNWRLGELAIASTRHSSGIGSVRLLAASSGCGYTQSVFDAWGIATVETCGANGLGPAYLVQLSPQLTVTSTLRLHPSSDPTSLSVSRDGDFVLVDEYDAPSAPEPNEEAGPRVWLYVFNGTSLQVIHVYPDDQYGISNASW